MALADGKQGRNAVTVPSTKLRGCAFSIRIVLNFVLYLV
jgi:hypothetical protein